MLGKDYLPNLTRSMRSNSGSISPESDDERVRISFSREQALKDLEKPAIEYHEYQDRYLSSEEDLSPMEEDYDDAETFQSLDDVDDESDFDVEKAIEAYASEAWADQAATTVSIIFTGRPKVIDVLPSPATSPTVSQLPSRDSSLNKNGNNRARPRPIIQNNRVSRLSGTFDVPPKSEWRRSSLYSIANPSSPRFLIPNRRNSTAESKALFTEEPVTSPTILEAPPIPSSPEYDAPPTTPRHGRFKSLHRLGLFKASSKKERKDSLTSASVIQLSQPSTPTPSMFAPSPFIRPQTAKLVARAADERESTMAMAALFSGNPTHNMGIEEVDEMLSEDSSSWSERDSSLRSKIRRRRSLNLL